MNHGKIRAVKHLKSSAWILQRNRHRRLFAGTKINQLLLFVFEIGSLVILRRQQVLGAAF